MITATGLTTSKQKAQDYVVTGAGLLAGSSILLLTLLWGVCFICARTKSVKYQGAQPLINQIAFFIFFMTYDRYNLFLPHMFKNHVIKIVRKLSRSPHERTKYVYIFYRWCRHRCGNQISCESYVFFVDTFGSYFNTECVWFRVF